jgi:nucleotide-binding universal stress UspA family protein
MRDSGAGRTTASLVCGVDFSPESRCALLYATALASRLDCPLHVVSAIEPLLAEAARIRRQLDAFVEHAARDLRSFVPVPPRLAERLSHAAVAGEPAPVILDAAANVSARLIVVGTRGHGQAARLLLGSTTLRLLRTTEIPVLVTDWKEESDMPEGARQGEVSRILCGVDFSEGSAAAVRAAATLASDLSVGLALVHAVAPAKAPAGWDGLAGAVEADWIADATARLTAMAEPLSSRPAVSVRVGSPADVLAGETAGDPLAIVAVGLRGAAHHRPGSTALRVVSMTKVPVLVA